LSDQGVPSPLAQGASRPAAVRSGKGAAGYWRLALLAVGVLCLFAMPFTGINDSVVLTMSTIFMWMIISSSWNLISGFAGYVDFGHGVFFGLGGYVTAILIANSGFPFGPTVPLAAIFCALVALVIGYPLLRLRGVYFSIAMLGAFLAFALKRPPLAAPQSESVFTAEEITL